MNTQQQHHKKAIVITQWWASVIAMLIATGMTGVFAYSWQANAEIAVMKRQIEDIRSVNVDTRLARIEEKLDWIIKWRSYGQPRN